MVNIEEYFKSEHYEERGSIYFDGAPLLICDASYEYSAQGVVERAQVEKEDVRYERVGIYIRDVLPGTYRLGLKTLVETDDGGQVEYVKALTLVHETAEEEFDVEASIVVDAGNVGIFPVQNFYNLKVLQEVLDEDDDVLTSDDWVEFLFTLMESKAYCNLFGVIVPSGFGDGLYDVSLYFNKEEQLVGMEIEFILEEDLE